MPKVKKTRFNQESWDFVAYWYFVKNPEVYKQKELLIHRTFSINKRGSGNPLLHFSIRQWTQFSSKRIPPIWNRLIFPGFWEYRYGLVVELKMNFKSVWIHNSICSFLWNMKEKLSLHITKRSEHVLQWSKANFFTYEFSCEFF